MLTPQDIVNAMVVLAAIGAAGIVAAATVVGAVWLYLWFISTFYNR